MNLSPFIDVVVDPQAMKSETPKSQSCVPKYTKRVTEILERNIKENFLAILEIIDKNCPLS